MSSLQSEANEVSVTFHLWNGTAVSLLVSGKTTVGEIKHRVWRNQRFTNAECDPVTYVVCLSDTRLYFSDASPMSDVFDMHALMDSSASPDKPAVDCDILPAASRLDHAARTRGIPKEPFSSLMTATVRRRESKALLNLFMWEARYIVAESYTLYIFKSRKAAEAGDRAQAVIPLEGMQGYGISNLTVSSRGSDGETFSESTSSHQNLLFLRAHNAKTTTPSPLALTSRAKTSNAVLLSRSAPGSPVYASNFTRDDIIKPREGVLVFSFDSAPARDEWLSFVNARHLRHVTQVWAACAKELLRRGCLATEGVFRLSGSHEHVALICSDVMLGVLDKLRLVKDEHAVAGVMKQAIRNLPDPPMTYGLYHEWLALAPAKAGEETDVEMGTLKGGFGQLFRLLPDLNRALVRQTLLFLHRTAAHEPTSRMGPRNLAVVFAPNLLRPLAESAQQAIPNQKKAVELTASLIIHAPRLFALPPRMGPLTDYGYINSPPSATSTAATTATTTTPAGAAAGAGGSAAPVAPAPPQAPATPALPPTRLPLSPLSLGVDISSPPSGPNAVAVAAANAALARQTPRSSQIPPPLPPTVAPTPRSGGGLRPPPLPQTPRAQTPRASITPSAAAAAAAAAAAVAAAAVAAAVAAQSGSASDGAAAHQAPPAAAGGAGPKSPLQMLPPLPLPEAPSKSAAATPTSSVAPSGVVKRASVAAASDDNDDDDHHHHHHGHDLDDDDDEDDVDLGHRRPFASAAAAGRGEDEEEGDDTFNVHMLDVYADDDDGDALSVAALAGVDLTATGLSGDFSDGSLSSRASMSMSPPRASFSGLAGSSLGSGGGPGSASLLPPLAVLAPQSPSSNAPMTGRARAESMASPAQSRAVQARRQRFVEQARTARDALAALEAVVEAALRAAEDSDERGDANAGTAALAELLAGVYGRAAASAAEVSETVSREIGVVRQWSEAHRYQTDPAAPIVHDHDN